MEEPTGEQHREQPQPSAGNPADPGYAHVKKYLLYTLSLPERALRSGGAVIAGTIRESTNLLVPQAFQDSKTYTVMVRQMLDFLAEDVGGVQRRSQEGAPPPVQDFVARKAVGNFIDLAGMATLHLSPALLLALVSDLAYGSKTYLHELSADLKEQGVIAQDSTIDHADDLLAAVARATSVTAGAFTTPPLSVEGLRQTIEETRAAVASIDPTRVLPQAETRRMWEEMRSIANREGVSVLDVSSAMTIYSLDRIAKVGRGALSTVRVAGTLFDKHIIDHYANAAEQIRKRGLYQTLAVSSQPYIAAVWQNFASDKETVTEGIFTGKLLLRTVSAMRGWFTRKPATALPASATTQALVTEAGTTLLDQAPHTADIEHQGAEDTQPGLQP